MRRARMSAGLLSDIAWLKPGVIEFRLDAVSALRRAASLFQHEPAVAVFPPYPRQERHAEQVPPERRIRQHEGRDITHGERADFDPIELDPRGPHGAVGGRHIRRIVARGRVNAETRGVALA